MNLVGAGGMGSVWEAYDERLRRPVAVKQLHRPIGLAPAEADLANHRAMREARITARLNHRHAVTVFDVAEHEGQPCLIMQFVPSVPLSEVLRETGPLQPHEAAKVGAQISSALAAAHAVDVLHRDVKPGNILIADDGNALISDFGIARALGDATLTTTGMVHGTPAFLAPEVARGAEASFASDVFSLGSTLYAAVEGTPPFGLDTNTMALLHRVASGVFPPPQHAGPLTPILLDMLAVDPEARPTMPQVAHAVDRLAAGPLPVARSAGGTNAGRAAAADSSGFGIRAADDRGETASGSDRSETCANGVGPGAAEAESGASAAEAESGASRRCRPGDRRPGRGRGLVAVATTGNLARRPGSGRDHLCSTADLVHIGGALSV